MCINGRRYVCCSECDVSNECNEPTPCFVQPIGRHGGDVMYFWCVCFRGELGFLNCDDICMCVVNKQFELLEFVFDYFYVDLQYHEMSLIFTTESVSLCCVCCHVVLLGLSVRLSASDALLRIWNCPKFGVAIFLLATIHNPREYFINGFCNKCNISGMTRLIPISFVVFCGSL